MAPTLRKRKAAVGNVELPEAPQTPKNTKRNPQKRRATAVSPIMRPKPSPRENKVIAASPILGPMLSSRKRKAVSQSPLPGEKLSSCKHNVVSVHPKSEPTLPANAATVSATATEVQQLISKVTELQENVSTLQTGRDTLQVEVRKLQEQAFREALSARQMRSQVKLETKARSDIGTLVQKDVRERERLEAELKEQVDQLNSNIFDGLDKLRDENRSRASGIEEEQWRMAQRVDELERDVRGGRGFEDRLSRLEREVEETRGLRELVVKMVERA